MKNVMFDLYGTLIDIYTDESIDIFWEGFAECSKKYKEYDYLELKKEYLRICDKLQQVKEEIEILDVFMELFDVDVETSKEIALIFREVSKRYVKKYPGVDKLLTKLKKKGYKLYVLSNAQRAFTIPEMEELDLIKYFDGIAISSDYGLKKPNKDFYLKAMNDFGLAAGTAWMVGNDYECDIRPAKELGLQTIYIESNLSLNTLDVPKFVGFSYKKISKMLLNQNKKS